MPLHAGRLVAGVLLPKDHHPVDLKGLGILRAGLARFAHGLEDRGGLEHLGHEGGDPAQLQVRRADAAP